MRALPTLFAVVITLSTASIAHARQNADASERRQAVASSVLAKSAYKRARYVEASRLYRQAYKLDPKTLGYLYSAARSAQRARNFDEARRMYERVISTGGEDSPFARKARIYLLQLKSAKTEQIAAQLKMSERARRQAETRLAAERRDRVAKQKKQQNQLRQRQHRARLARAVATQRETRRQAAAAAQLRKRSHRKAITGWAVSGLGGALFAGGTALWLMRDFEASDLASQVNATSNISVTELNRMRVKADAIKRDKKVASAFIGAGLTCAIAGAWFALTSSPSSSKTVIAPTPRGLVMVRHF